MSTSTAINYPSDIEWVSSDYKATAAYFTQALGWNMKDMPEQQMAFGDWGLKMVAMLSSEMPHDKGLEQRAKFYFTVPDVNAEIQRLAKFGAAVFKEPQLVPNMGYWCLVKIPGNLILGLWNYLPGTGPEPRQLTKKPTDETVATYFELVNKDAKQVAEFFKNAYGWTFQESTFLGGQFWYTSDNESKAFMLGIRQPKAGERSDLTAFVTTNTMFSTRENLTKAGAKFVGQVEDYSPHGHCQKLNIPGGIVIGIWEPARVPLAQAPKEAAAKSAVEAEKPGIQHIDVPSH
jgi:predicted enzyme related to lactoylglutathione lyase